MKFSITEWRRTYDLVQMLSRTLQDGRSSYTEHGKLVPPLIHLSRVEQKVIEKKIKLLLHNTSKYLDHCGLKPKKPLWHYDIKNPETHASAKEFKYGHLLKV